ncbi:MAG: amino acid adenylation domain-containing protein, partial [Deltaproteobacteria bacterium]
TGAGAAVTRRLRQGLRERVESYSRALDATPFATMLAAFYVVLARHSGQNDLMVATAVANRTHAATEGLIGFFANTLVLRGKLGDAPSFAVLVRRVRDMVRDALAHQDLPFERLVEALRPERQIGRMPLAQVGFNYQNTTAEALEIEGLTLRALPLETSTSRRDLSLSIAPGAAELDVVVEYSTELFAPETIDRVVDHYEILLEAALASPELPVDRLALLSAGESGAITLAGAEAADEPTEAVHELIENWAARRPTDTAVLGADGALDFATLDRRATGLAAALRALGIGTGSVVALSVSRTTDVAVGVLGILKAGAAWLPIDPSYPDERRAFMLRDAGAVALVIHARSREAWADASVPCIDLDALAYTADESSTRTTTRVPLTSTAYIVYTSGSTGVPKGVAVPHSSLARYARAMRERLGVTERDIYAHTATISFSSAVRQLIVPLTSGAAVWFASTEEILEPAVFARAVRDRSVTILDLVPSYWRALEQALLHLPGAPRREILHNRVRLIASASEPLSVDIPRTWSRDLAHPAVLVNMYGQTETAGIVATHTITAEDFAVGRARVPIGTPIRSCGLYVLDPHGAAVPTGVLGELWVAGGTLATGYVGRGDLTSERFVADAVDALPGARMYRTGDLARRRADGVFEHLGRADAQVKIRGFRVETGEVENALRAHASIGDALVRAIAHGSENRLIAYVVPAEGLALTIAASRAFLQRSLPDYMIPSSIHLIERLPRTATGKIDVGALPAPDSVGSVDAAAHEPPRTNSERLVADVWGASLGRPALGRTDHFFDAGGHSLLATHASAHLAQRIGRDVPLRWVFESPVLADFALRLDALCAMAPVMLEPIELVDRSGRVPLSFAQQRLWFLQQLDPTGSAYNIPIGLRAHGRLDRVVLRRCLAALVARHETLRTTFVSVDGEPSQVVAEVGSIDIPEIDLSALPPADRERELGELATREARAPFDLVRGPLLRVTFVRLGDDDAAVLFTIHHIISDGWSRAVLVREFGALYDAMARGRTPHLEPLSIQYADYAAWQRRWLQGERLDAELDYWRRRLDRAPGHIELPLDRPRPPVQTSRGAHLQIAWPAALTRDVAAFARRESATVFMTLMASFAVLLSRYSGQDDVVVGTPIANRTRPEVQSLIGLFANTLAVRTELQGEPSFRDLLARVRERTLDDFAHQDVPFERLVDELKIDRDLSRSPLFQVMFSLQNAGGDSLELPDVQLSSVDVESGIAKFDLLLSLTETTQGLAGYFEYNTDLFDGDTIQRFSDDLVALTASLLSRPDLPVSRVALPASPEDSRHLAPDRVGWPFEPL